MHVAACACFVKLPPVAVLARLVASEVWAGSLGGAEVANKRAGFGGSASSGCVASTGAYKLEKLFGASCGLASLRGVCAQFKSCACRHCGLWRALLKSLCCKPGLATRWVAVSALLKLGLDQKLTQLARALIVVSKFDLGLLGIRCIRKARALMWLATAANVANNLKAAKRSLVGSSASVIADVIKAYPSCDAQDPALASAGRDGLMASANRFDLVSGYRFAAYSKWWVKHNVIAHVLAGAKGWAAASAKQLAGAAKLKRLSLDYCGGGASLHEAVEGGSALAGGVLKPAARGAQPRFEARCDDYTLISSLMLLAPREERVVRLRGRARAPFSWSLRRIGLDVGLTRERVRQLALSASTKLASAALSCSLASGI
ncbi:putative RNA polymerase sigma factor [Candidatus Hodgkinia cicadicola Dsem]|nr:putative RNA polymerase sigma factor [Candidatus Hodgkinia cicadicola Dsem]